MDEATIETELVAHGVDPGALVLTDQRLLYYRSSPFSRKEKVLSIPLLEVVDVEVSEERLPIRKRGVLLIRKRAPGAQLEVKLSLVDGSCERAIELARKIREQQRHLLSGGGGISPALSPESEAPEETPVEPNQVRPNFILGRGVARFVRARGGRLYVWGEPIGGFEWLKASTAQPARADLVRVDGFDEFELYLQESLFATRRLRLARRWFPPRSIVVDTGRVIG